MDRIVPSEVVDVAGWRNHHSLDSVNVSSMRVLNWSNISSTGWSLAFPSCKYLVLAASTDLLGLLHVGIVLMMSVMMVA